MSEDRRVAMTTSCRDADYIPKVKEAGEILNEPGGRKIQVMHNGIRVCADAYYGQSITRIVEKLRGHHEPQEEKIFFEVLKKISPGATMVELGAYWSYYSLWFQKTIPDAKNYMVEPEASNLEVGRLNFELNQATGTFEHAFVSNVADNTTSPPSISVDELVRKHSITKIAILHSDIQGFETMMLDGAKGVLGRKDVRFLFVSTHGNEIHQRCLNEVKRLGYHQIASHTPGESYSVDGLIVASAEREFTERIQISCRRTGLTLPERCRQTMFRMGIYDVLSGVFTHRYPGLLHRILR